MSRGRQAVALVVLAVIGMATWLTLAYGWEWSLAWVAGTMLGTVAAVAIALYVGSEA